MEAQAPRIVLLTVAAFAVLCFWAAPAMSAAGLLGVFASGSVAIGAWEKRMRRTALLGFAITQVSAVQIILLLSRVRSTWPYKLLWLSLALVATALLVSYVIGRRRDV